MRAKETLQLRHQLSASGLSLRAATYDTRRHHVLTFDSHPLRPHVLRLFSLRRELKSVSLIDDAKRDKSSNSSPTNATLGSKRPSFFELQQQEQQKRLKQSDVEVVVPTVLLQYSRTLDVFLCVYNTATRPRGATKVPKTTTHFVVLLEPATLRKLLVYQGPETHTLQCAHFDPLTDRLVVASHLENCDHDGGMLPKAPNNVIEILQLSKRLDDRPTSWSADFEVEQQQPSMLLLIENTRASLRHPDSLNLVCGSKGLKELYGAAGDYSDSADTLSVMLVWRQNQLNGGKLGLMRRVMLQHTITAMAVSPCGNWLLVGVSKGGLRVWNVHGSRLNGSEMFTIDTDPYEPTESGVADAQAEVISSIEVITTSAPDLTGNTVATDRLTDAIIIAAERDTGAVRHWRLSVERKNYRDDINSEEHRYPRLSLVGYFDVGGKSQIGKDDISSRIFKNQDTLGPPLRTLTMCVTIDMGSCFENLLLVVREDVIHVLKVQTVLYVMQEYALVEEVYAVRAFEQQDSSQIISLSSTAARKLRVFPLDETSNQGSSSKSLFVTPHAPGMSGHVCSMETMANYQLQICFVVLAWSRGIVDIYDVLREKHAMKLQDKQLTDQISTLAVVHFQRAIKHKNMSAYNAIGEAGFLSSPSYWDTSHHHTDCLSSDTSEEAVAHKTIIVAGTESGNLYGWYVEALWDNDFTLRSIEKANVRVQDAHSSHIIQLASLDAVRGQRALLASVGTGGIIKLWSIPSLKLIGYVNSVAEGYPVSPSCIELMRNQENNVGSGGQKAGGKLHVSVGYDDGRLAVWCVNVKRVSFQKLEASTKHERRVTKICRIARDVVSSELTEFLSSSLDMTVIHWQISECGSVQEKRYFDIGAAIVDMVLVNEQAIVALAHEVCKFTFAPSSNNDKRYLMNPKETTSDADKHTSEPLADDEYPDTPTTRSVEDSTELSTPSHKTVDEYLTLHVPSAVLHLEADSSSVVADESAPATGDQSEAFFSLRDENSDNLPQHARGSKKADKLHRTLINDDILREYLHVYLVRYGNGDTIAANRISHLLALRPELPSIKRPGFALTKTLKELKLTAQTRVDVEEALQILRIMFTMSKTPYQSYDAPTMAGTLKHKDNTSERARAQRLREKNRARRKPVVTYNLLGEKYVRWEEELADNEEIGQNQSPSSSKNLFEHTPPSPNKDDMNALDGDHSPDFCEPTSKHTPDSTANTVHAMPEILSPTCQALVDDSTVSESVPAESDKPDTASPVSHQSPVEESDDEDDDEESDEEEGEEEDGDEEEESDDNDTDAEGDNGGNDGAKDQDNVNNIQATPSEATLAIPTAKKSRGVKRARKFISCGVDISRNALVKSIRLSPTFQQFWRTGYCWCSPAPQLQIIWTHNGKAKTGKRRLKCKACHQRLHTVELPRVRYVPHFSRQNTLDIIVQVYNKLTGTAHTSLYKNSSTKKDRSSECSIVSTLFDLFLTTYGVHSTAEMKLKQFFVSLCQYLPEYDAVAVFGELLGLHTPDNAEECDQAPTTLVALCVCCYSWLYSRGMVVNGDTFSGRLYDRDGGKSYTTSEATDGTTHWQFVRVEHALLCAQDNLLYPLVSPEFLRNIMLFIQEYAQREPTRMLRVDSPDFSDDIVHGDRAALWIELHRFLRLLVGEWKFQNAQFRAVERLLFVHPQRDIAIEGELLEKLRLMLSCFVFYDHERVGVMAVGDFETLLFKLRYLWTGDSTAMEDAFDSVMSAIKQRFQDLDHDGQLCYLDFWVMLYIVGVKTRSLILFLEIPSFCRDYRLEVSPELSDMVWNYMQLSCTLVLPKGLQIGKSSMDQKAERQHRRRVGGLHDGVFHFPKTLTSSLSTQELLRTDDSKKLGLFLDGSVPATRLTASTTALDRFRPLSVESDLDSGRSSRRRRREPVVFGIRSSGPAPKPIAPLRVSLMGNYDSVSDTNSTVRYENYSGVEQASTRQIFKTGYTNMYVQFPEVQPVRRRVGETEVMSRQTVGTIPVEDSSEESSVVYEDSVVEQEELVQEEEPSSVRTPLSRIQSATSVVPVLEMVQEEVVNQPEPRAQTPVLEKRRSATPVVVVPTVEPEARATSRRELLKRKSSVRVASAQAKLEEVAVQLEAEKVEIESPPSLQPTPVATARDEPPADENEGEVSGDDDTEFDEDVEQTSVQYEEPPLEEPEEPVPIVVEEVPPESEPVVEDPVEIAEPVVTSIIPELVVDSVESPVVVEDPPEQIVVAEVAEVEVVEEEMSSTPTPIEEPVLTEDPVPDLSTESEIASEEEVAENPDSTLYKPQVIKQDDTQILHGFRFSQQPAFIRSVAATNPYRTAMWNPNDDSESDGDDDDAVESIEQQQTLDVEGVHNSLHSTKDASKHPHDLQDKGDDNAGILADTPLIPFRRKRLDEDAERALYGERIVNVLGEGIAFSPETEAAMQKKWQQFFDESESKMFTTMRYDLEKKQTEQREAEERQIKLRKKWQEQRDQDLQRLQHSRQSSTLLMSTKQDSNGGVDAGFRLRRIHRESCRQLTEELQFGVSMHRELKEAKGTQFFHFYYLPDSQGSIITLKMHVLRGDAEVFMSTDTKVPCSTDFMWRSSERLMEDSGEGHRIILYPHDLLKAASNASMAMETNASTALRSFYPKQDATAIRVGFYLSVVALEPDTEYTVAVMSSGQKMQPSRAIQTVDYLIDRFNMLSRSFQEHSTVSYSSIIPEDVNELDNEDVDEDEDSEEVASEPSGRRKTRRITANGVDPQELKSFQRLLETLSEKKGFGSPRAASILLNGPSDEHLEFVQDEDQRLQEMHHRLSPSKTCPDAVSVVTERRLTLQGKRQKLRRVVAARLQQKLAPLRHKSSAGELEKSLVNIRMPRPVAYSITTLDPLPRSQRLKAAVLPLPQDATLVRKNRL